MILGSKLACDFRVIVEGIFTRYMAGDTSMIQEIRTNATSSPPIHQVYHQTLVQEPVTTMASSKPMLDRDEAIFNWNSTSDK